MLGRKNGAETIALPAGAERAAKGEEQQSPAEQEQREEGQRDPCLDSFGEPPEIASFQHFPRSMCGSVSTCGSS